MTRNRSKSLFLHQRLIFIHPQSVRDIRVHAAMMYRPVPTMGIKGLSSVLARLGILVPCPLCFINRTFTRYINTIIILFAQNTFSPELSTGKPKSGKNRAPLFSSTLPPDNQASRSLAHRPLRCATPPLVPPRPTRELLMFCLLTTILSVN